MCSEHPDGINEGDIDLILAEVKNTWMKNPHSRLGQLLLNAMLKKTPKYDMFTFFYLENSKLVEALRAF